MTIRELIFSIENWIDVLFSKLIQGNILDLSIGQFILVAAFALPPVIVVSALIHGIFKGGNDRAFAIVFIIFISAVIVFILFPVVFFITFGLIALIAISNFAFKKFR